MSTYRIMRFYQNHSKEQIASGLSLEEAKKICNDPETSSSTATSQEAKDRTGKYGPWFCGYVEE